ncbi:MAG: hypothetical protein GY760_18790 [Deltaproteobacteria bacterium]|nr:hypothetical protein [Deltaproteobacteria bacterium]
MTNKLLRPGDGFKSQRPELRDEVKILQEILIKNGYDVDSDGYFGEGSVRAVKAFQEKKGLTADGVVGINTWYAFTGIKQAVLTSFLDGFRGDSSWVHAREGHAGKAYWPGGESGVTLDPGVDLGYIEHALAETLYADILTEDQLNAVKGVYGIKGEKAKEALSQNQELKSIKISRDQADSVFPFAVDPYWKLISKRFRSLLEVDTPGSVQTVMLSLAYNRGAGNKGLEILRKPLEEKKWLECADLLGEMQQDHKLEGIRKRRRMEAEYVREKFILL